MPECDYCEESFGDEDAYLDHLAADHEGELGAIDRRRVDSHDGGGDGGLSVGPVVLVALLALSGALVVWVTFFMGGGGGDGAGAAGARDIPDDPLLEDAESFPSEGNNHVSSGANVDYERMPPLSGPHYQSAARPDFYEQTPPLGNLVHSLEHGHVVIYYDADRLSEEARNDMANLTTTYTDAWSAVTAAPNPSDDPAAAYVLTAWRVRLPIDEYDPDTVQAFLDAFRGRGPENSVR